MSKLLVGTILSQFAPRTGFSQYNTRLMRKNPIVASAYLRYDSFCSPPMKKLKDPIVWRESSGLELLL